MKRGQEARGTAVDNVPQSRDRVEAEAAATQRSRPRDTPCKGPGAGQGWAWRVGGTARRPVWLEHSEQWGEREEGRAGRGRGRWHRASWAAAGRTRAFTIDLRPV